MIFVVHAETDGASVARRLGRPEYSYHFVLKRFVPLLERFGSVVEISTSEALTEKDARRQVDAVFAVCEAVGEACLFLSFSPPHRTPLDLRCPTVCVFAWEYADLPGVGRTGDGRDWRFVLSDLGLAVTHSEHAAAVTRAALGPDFPVAVIPAPVWDGFARPADEPPPPPRLAPTSIELEGEIFEARPGGARAPAALTSHVSLQLDLDQLPSGVSGSRGQSRLELAGVVYLAAFNPYDGRKNWRDIVRCFGLALGERSDAVLVLKLIQAGSAHRFRRQLRHELEALGDLACRVVVVHGFLDGPTYRRLLSSATWVVNASTGEGQCLPLMEAMSAGRPAIAPAHTGMADYVDEDNALLVGSSLEPVRFPHEPDGPIATWQHRLDAHSLYRAFQESYRIAVDEPGRYGRMSHRAAESLRQHCSLDAAEAKLTAFLERIGDPPPRGAAVPSSPRPVPAEARAAAAPERLRTGPVPGVDLHFIIAGFAKCGTTTLSALLGRHPGLHVPTNESWFFTRGQGADLDAEENVLRHHFSGATPGRQLGLCGVAYSSVTDEVAARDRILARYPGIRLIFIARDPLERVESAFRELHHSWHRVGLAPPPFAVREALAAVPQLVEDCRFAERLATYASAMAADRIHVLFLEELLANPRAVLRGCFEFLGVDPAVDLDDSLPLLNPGTGKLVDGPRLRELMEPGGAVKFALQALSLELRDRFLVPLGLRGPWSGPPDRWDGWDGQDQRRFAAAIEHDARTFLSDHGRRFSLWPRFAATLGETAHSRAGRP